MIGIPSSSNSHDARRPSARGALVLLAAVVFLFTSAVHAGRYELVKGKGVEVCEAYEKNLNAVDIREPLVCEREIHSQFNEFKKPEWKQLDLWENRMLYWSIKNTLDNLPQDRPMTKGDEEWIKQRSQPGWAPQMYVANTDIDNDGRIESVVMYKGGICGLAQRVYATALLVQREAEPRIDLDRTYLLLQNEHRDKKTREIQRTRFDYLFNMYGVFRYKNLTYFDKANDRPEERDRIQVYLISRGQTQRVCEYRFTDTTR